MELIILFFILGMMFSMITMMTLAALKQKDCKDSDVFTEYNDKLDNIKED